MFGLLKEKLSSFIGKFTKKEEEKIEEQAPKEAQKPQPIEKKEPPKKEEPAPVKKEIPKPQPVPEKNEIQKPAPAEEEEAKPAAMKKEETAPEKKTEKPIWKKPEEKISKKKEPAKKEEAKPPEAKEEQTPPEKKPKILPPEAKKEEKSFFSSLPFFGKKPEEKKPEQAPAPQVQKPTPAEAKPAVDETQRVPPQQPKAHTQERKLEVKIGLGEQIKSLFTGEVQIKENDVCDLLEELHMALLEADVAYEVSGAVCGNLKQQLVGMKIRRGEVGKAAKSAMQNSLEAVLSSEHAFDFIEKVRSLPKPAVVLFVGPNGAGKTTTMAKLAKMLQGNAMNAVFSASDTFRAAAIEQTEVHGKRLGVHVIKSAYGADPAAVAFDAVAYARAHNIDVVLVDSAGRQDTNTNLLDELKKINRVAKPHLKIYIGESIGGNAVIDQIKAFNEAVGIDGVILTKLDCDAKGGTALSITYATKIPIVYFGVGQKYEDLIAYNAHSLAQEILT